MRIVAIIANLISLGLSIFLVIDELNYIDGWTILIFSVFILTPIISIIALIISRRGGKSFIGLWFARKALEEKKKIEKLQSQKTSEQ